MKSYASQTLDHVAGLIRRYTFYLALDFCAPTVDTTELVILSTFQSLLTIHDVPRNQIARTFLQLTRHYSLNLKRDLSLPTRTTGTTENESVHSAKRGVLPLARVIEHRTRFLTIDELRFHPPNVPNLLHATVLRVTRRQFRGSPGGGRPGDFFRRVGPSRV